MKKPYFIFKNVSEGYYVNLGSLEPVEYASVTAKSGFEQSESLSWLRTVYDVRKIFEEKDEYVYVPDLRSFGNK